MTMLDDVDRAIINRLQLGLPLSERPFEAAGESLGIDERTLIARLAHLLETGVLSRLGPMFDAERLGGAFCLCAMAVPRERFEAIAEIVNGFHEVAHNYERDHRYNMWFVLATSTPQDIDATVRRIEEATGLEVLVLPKLEEFYVGLQLAV